jgi:hypothetical protein
MRKILLLSILFLSPVFAFATSGACSGHGGVSCSAGSDNDGSVICNDGWRNSSVQYSSMVMCANYNTSESEQKIEVKTIPTSTPKPIIKDVTPTSKPATVRKTESAKKQEVIPEKSEPKAAINIQPSDEVVPVTQNKPGFWSRVYSFLFK